MQAWLISLTLAVLIILNTPVVRAQDSLQPQAWDAGLKLMEASDRNPDPRIVEVDVEARVETVELSPGLKVEAWTYNGGIPGPLIRARVGDRLIVHFTNRLPQPTTIHWHGLRIPIQMDGVPDVSQPAVQTGGAFTYDFVVPDAGTFWYHPHVMSAAQVGFGLYGALLVDDPAERIGVVDELTMVLSDLATEEGGRLESPDSGGGAGMVFGREGNHVLVNGRERPRMVARAGAPQRWRVVNAAKSRFFELSLDNHSLQIIGSDGGLLEHPVTRETVVLGPGERADLIVSPTGTPGSELTLRSLLFNRGYGSVETRPPFDDLVTIALTSDRPLQPARLPTISRSITPLSTAGATAVNLKFTLAQAPDGSFAYGIDGVPFAEGRPISAKPGETQVWTITNTTKWSHPFHLHGFFFQVLDANGAPVRPLEWKDTVNVPLEQTRRLVVRYDDREGSWMFHCHVLDHAEGGLMGWVELGAAATTHRMKH
ncbi:MAG: multicopper oxidase family protein [Vicinamibacterales bacterium]